MSRTEDAWEDVGDQFKKLGSLFRGHFEAQETGEPDEILSDSEVGEAVRSFGESVQTALGAVVDTVTDPAVHEEARHTAGSILEALGETFAGLGEDLRDRDEEEPE